MRSLRLWLALWPLLAGAAAGLDPRQTLTQYGHTAWLVRDGAFAEGPTAIAQTRDGFLWLGTNAGLRRFDGVRFTPWEPPPGSRLPDGRIVTLLGSRDGSLWIGTGNGLARWDGSKLTVYARKGRFGTLLEDRHGTVWIGHTRALADFPPLCRFAQGRLGCFRFPDGEALRYVGALSEDPQGDVWIGGEAGACRWRAEGPECHPIAELVPLRGKSGVFQLAADADGALLATSLPSAVWRLSRGRWARVGPPDPAAEAEALFSDREKGLWLGVRNHGLVRRVGGRTERFTRNDGLSGDDINAFLEDRDGDLWVATSEGLDRFRDVKVATLTSREGLPGSYFSAVAASRDGSVWVAERHALLHLQPGGVSSFGSGNGLPGGEPGSLLEDSRGRLWVGIDDGLAWREKGRFFQLRMPDGAPIGIVHSMVEDRDGSLWASTTRPDRSVVRAREGRIVEWISAARLGGRQAVALAVSPSGGIWIGDDRGGVGLYREGTFEPWGGPGDRSESLLHGLFADARGLWAMTSRGLGLVRKSGWATLDARNGLPCDDVQEAVPGEAGSLWLKTSCGLVQISAGELDAWALSPRRRVRVRLLDALDGVRSGLPPFTPRAARSRDGRLWFAVEGGGVQVLDPRSLAAPPALPPVQVLHLVADRQAFPLGSRLPALTRDLEIDYTVPYLAVPEKVRFRYRLDGAASGWQEAGTRREAFFTNLGPGSYRFRVAAAVGDGAWTPAGAAVAFAIPPAFYQTGAFYALCVAACLGLLWAAYQWRLRQVREGLSRVFEERLAERTRIARELHDTLLQGFLSASMQLYAAAGEIPPDAPVRGRLDRVQALMRQVIDEGREALRGLRSAAPEAEELALALSRVPEELGDGGVAGLRVVVEGTPVPLRPVFRDEAYRIAREALVNAFRHAGAAKIELEIEYGTRRLRVRVRDDGRGIDPEVLRAGRAGHWGLPGMRERAEAIGGRLQVWSRAGAGTEVELAAPARIAYAER